MITGLFLMLSRSRISRRERNIYDVLQVLDFSQ
jgi:hypothetical protein